MRKIEGIARYVIISIILIVLFTVNLNAVEDKLIFLRIFKLNMNWSIIYWDCYSDCNC